MSKSNNIFARFFGVIIRGQSYLNILYLLLALPLGVFYYVFLIGGFTLGIALLIVLIGVLVLLVVFAAWVAFVAFERQLAVWLLREEVPAYLPEGTISTGTSGFVGHILVNRATWTGLLFLFLKLPLGAVSLALMAALIGITLLSLGAPVIYNFFLMELWLPGGSVWRIDTIGEALILFVIGLAMIFISLHLINIIAWFWGRMAFWMLGVETKPAFAVQPVAVEEAVEVEKGAPAADLEGVEAELVAAGDVATSAEAQAAEIEGVEEQGEDIAQVASEAPDSETPLITPPPDQQTRYIDEADLPSGAPEDKELSPPEWLLERYDALEYYEAETPPEPAEEPARDLEAQSGEEQPADEPESEESDDEEKENT